MTTYPLAHLSAQIGLDGISSPTFGDILASLQAQYRTIFGADSYLEADSQDGQWLSILALLIKDVNDMAIAVYQAYSPATAQGNGLDTAIKINGLSRALSSHSTAEALIVGVPGTIITAGFASDGLGTLWKLPDTVVIPDVGQITVTLTANDPGNIVALAGSIINIETAVLGWQSIISTTDATPGLPIETDAILRRRQKVSTSLPAQNVLTGIVGAVANLPGVEQWQVFENFTDITDVKGIPGHSFALVVQGGDDTAIAQAIAVRKTPGAGTYGTTTVIVTDEKGIPTTINFFRPTVARIQVQLMLRAQPGYVSTTGDAIRKMMSDDVSGLGIGEDVNVARLYTPANLAGDPLSLTYKITGLKVTRDSAPFDVLDIPLGFTEVARLAVGDVSLTVT